MKQFKDKIAIVTGGGAGIGRSICEEMANAGAKVIVADINEENGKKVAEGIEKNGGKAEYKRVDVSSEIEVKKLIEEIETGYGRIDYIFNNAGIAIGGDARDIKLEQWKKVMDINYYGVLYGSLYAYQVMAKQGFGHIINTSSATGLMPQPGNSPYCASKHAVIGLSLSLRYEGADLGVKVSAICPGHVQTDIYRNMEVAKVPNEKMVASLPVKAMDTKEATSIILNGIIKNKDIIIFPKNVAFAWRLNRFFPGLLDKAWLEKIRNIRKLRQEN
ncbi:NADP-dependent 3-hydroxy acid dehydrogenase YdfG [Mobilisporobacter senegalensis]|uniref:NADP-dependent 3-hydroxy acid dehydrogenase YdfG n=1 Tax=Mobilisporobacter senegalensis TaxID=1329262 RepID=A0A3N1XKN6_9FIRM|nr:SDR family oxidoreductase [Mobilisporobacter senegalensis]ROR27273.1 NADP-dependent 3-hydroxy acid dehydrogenase YdfG [Mobilisporobacter senegalensis]